MDDINSDKVMPAYFNIFDTQIEKTPSAAFLEPHSA